MFITDRETLKNYESKKRVWQGIPSIEVTEKGRIFLTFYSGGMKEEIGNYVMLIRSDDNGDTFTEPVAVCDLPEHRCYDPCLWIDPLKRLWLTFSVCPDDALYGVICADPDAETLEWGDPFMIGHNVMMNKPIVTSDGRWLFPVAVWNYGVRALPEKYDSRIPEKGSFVYETKDQGKTFVKLGTPDVQDRCFDEHMLVERKDGKLRCYVRTLHGIGCADSEDGGLTFGPDFDAGFGGPNSRFHVRRLSSGRLLLINHWHFKGRNNLYAMLSDDDGDSFPYRLLLDARNDVAYPDAKELPDGRIYITYDRERGGFQKYLVDALKSAREILTACITEEDIMAGTLVHEGSYLRKVASKLTDTASGNVNYQKGAYLDLFEDRIFENTDETVGNMRYYVYDPVKHGMPADRKYPVLFGLHGNGHSLVGKLGVNWSGMEHFASPEYQEKMGGAYIVVPFANEVKGENGNIMSWPTPVPGETLQGYTDAEKDFILNYEPVSCKDRMILVGGKNSVYTDSLFRLLKEARDSFGCAGDTFLFGTSAGGYSAWRMLITSPETFRAVMLMSATYQPSDAELDKVFAAGTPVWLYHGKHDEVVPYGLIVEPKLKRYRANENFSLFLPEIVRHADGTVAENGGPGWQMGQHCTNDTVGEDLMYNDGTPMDQAHPSGVTGWIRSFAE